jgi:hypothetical protein
MQERFGLQPDKDKAQGVADAINRLVQNLVLKCAKSEGIRDYFHIGVIGYGGRAASALGGTLNGRTLVPISLLANNPLRVEQRTRKVDDGAGGILEQSFRFPVWFDAKAKGKTPMCQALTLAWEYVGGFLKQFPTCYPPLVIHITDGQATDGDPLPISQAVQGLRSADGGVLLFNAHLSSRRAQPLQFPSDEKDLPDDFARLLFRMSSLLPPRIREAAKGEGFLLPLGTRGFVFNADLVSIIRFLNLGTQVAHGDL